MEDINGNLFIPVNNITDDENDWRFVRFKEIENDDNLNINLPFNIYEIKEIGFIVRVYGLFCYIPFNYMPWKYSNNYYWELVYPTLQRKTFFAHILRKNVEYLSFYLNAKIPQFKTPVLTKNEKYLGVILRKENNYILIDIGYHFDWSCGSITGLLHKDNFNLHDFRYIYEEGEIISVNYGGIQENEILLYKDQTNKWISKKEADSLIGTKVIAKIVNKKEDFFELLIDKNRPPCNAILPFNNYIYSEEFIEKIKNHLNSLVEVNKIKCEIIEIDRIEPLFILKWIHPFKDNFNWESKEIYNLVGEKVLIDIIKNDEENMEFFVFDNCKAIMPITEEIYKEPDPKKLKNRFRGVKTGSKLKGEILDINVKDKIFTVKWYDMIRKDNPNYTVPSPNSGNDNQGP